MWTVITNDTMPIDSSHNLHAVPYTPVFCLACALWIFFYKCRAGYFFPRNNILQRARFYILMKSCLLLVSFYTFMLCSVIPSAFLVHCVLEKFTVRTMVYFGSFLCIIWNEGQYFNLLHMVIQLLPPHFLRKYPFPMQFPSVLVTRSFAVSKTCPLLYSGLLMPISHCPSNKSFETFSRAGVQVPRLHCCGF